MGHIQDNLKQIGKCIPNNVHLVAVSKYYSIEDIREAYDAGQRIFGESRMQELTVKQAELPDDIDWHFIGHLQTNKVKHVVPYVSTIHSVDSLKLLQEIEVQASKARHPVDCFLEVHISQDENKYGFTIENYRRFLAENRLEKYIFAKIKGLMGIASNTSDKNQIREEFRTLKHLFEETKEKHLKNNHVHFSELSMGMSHDYRIAIEEGATIVRVGSSIFEKNNNL